MASRYYGVNKGGRAENVVEDSSTTSKKVELVIDLTAGLTRAEVLEAIEYIEQKIINGVWPPA